MKTPESLMSYSWNITKPINSYIEVPQLPFLIVPIKVPIEDEGYHTALRNSGLLNQIWTWQNVFRELNKMLQTKAKSFQVHTVIDTASEESDCPRLYKGSTLSDRFGVNYVKLRTQGGGRKPRPEMSYRFIKILARIKKQIERCEDPAQKQVKPVVVVHCKHGINRTGYYICDFLIRMYKYPPERALRTFRVARGHDINHKKLKDDLKGYKTDIKFSKVYN